MVRPASRRPNVLVIVADDLGYADLSSYGCPHIRTPRIDRLGAEGIRFTDGYAGSATCSPTRISLYTGRYPGRLLAGLSEPIAAASPQLGLPPEHPTLATHLDAAGYHTAMLGKWHCGALPWFSPLRSGWREFFGNLGGSLDYFSHLNNRGVHDLHEGEVEAEDLRYYTHALTAKAVDVVRERAGEPWLVNLNYTTPHWPWEGPRDRAVSAGLSARLRAGEKRVLQHRDGGSLATYVEMVEDLDTSVGVLLDALEDSGQARDTFVLFFSDNGGERFSYQWPLSGAKFDLLEGGIRVPTIVRWPAAVQPGRVSAEPVVTMDWTATIVRLAGADLPGEPYPMDAVDLGDHLRDGTPVAERDLFWRVRDARALRRGRWKYYAEHRPDGSLHEALFDLGADLREKADLSRGHPRLLHELRAAWERIDAGLLPYPATG